MSKVLWANGYKNSALYKRRKEVNDLTRVGFLQKEIAQKLGLTIYVVQSDIAYNKKHKKTRVKRPKGLARIVSKYDACED